MAKEYTLWQVSIKFEFDYIFEDEGRTNFRKAKYSTLILAI